MAHPRLLAAAFAAALALNVAAPAARAAENPAAGSGSAQVQAAPFALNKGDHVCIIGNTLGDRLQHSGWLEATLYARNPDKDIVVRNLAYSGDEIELSKRLRSKDFGTPDQWLSGNAPVPNPKKVGDPKAVAENRFEHVNTKADVVFAFFGYNESYAGEKGLPDFKKNLDAELKRMLGQKYNGKSAPRIVLFSPIAHEDLKDPHLPDGKENNARLKLYTAAMAEVAKANNVTFVDLFAPTLAAYAKADKPLTINGVHLTEDGDRVLAGIIDAALFGAPAADPAKVEKLRPAVVDKAWHWFHRYRTTDGYSTYGDRAFLQFKPDNQSNYEVLQRELEVLDALTAERDAVIWAAAQGKPAKPGDAKLPPFIPVKTNKPGPGEGGTHVYQSGQDAIKDMKPAEGLKVELFADEKQFPDLIKPVQMSFDTKGRLWVATWPSYPHWQPTTPMADKLLILEDTDGDGKADKVTTFAGDLHNPTGFEFYNGGVLVAQGPDLWFYKDTTGDDKYDVKSRVLHGFDTADTHHTINSFTFDPGGALYFQEGTFHHTQVETPWGPTLRNANGAVYRYEPRTQKLSVYTAYGYANPHGHVFDKWGTDIITDGTGANPYYGPAYSGHVDFPRKHQKAPQVYKQRTRPLPGSEILSSSHFPQYNGNFLPANVIGFLGILNYKITEKGGGIEGKEVEPILVSSDPNFRPSDLEVAPDGSLYFTDWQNTIIGHMQHNLRDPSRDKQHGRIYRITNTKAPLLKPAKIAGEPIPALLDLLKSPEDRVRYRAKIELSGRKGDEVVAATKKWAAGLDKADPNYEHQLTEALWVHQWHDAVDVDLLKTLLRAKEPHARAAATRVLCYWRDRVPGVLDLLKVQAGDDSPRVALEAVRACSFFGKADAAKASDVASEAVVKHDKDPFVAYTLDETLKQLEAVQKAK
ncbi:MAG TPA: PVC-type heme-binding CxxCH protein [Humisphaera sp.]